MAERPSKTDTQKGKKVIEKRSIRIEIIRNAMLISYMV